MTDTSASTDATTNESSDDVTGLSLTTLGLCAALVYFSIVFVLSLLCNGTICVVFYKRPNLLTVSNSLVLNLTCCELGLSILIMPFLILSLISRKWVMSDIWCRAQAYLLTMFVVCLQYSLLIIAVDRHYSIVNSLRYPYIFSPRLGNILIAITWILGVAIGMPPLFTYGEFTYHRSQFVCTLTFESQSKYSVFVILATFLLPLIVQTFCYISIFKAAIKHAKSANRVYPSVASTSAAQDITVIAPLDGDDVFVRTAGFRSKKTECKAVKTILIIYGSYLLSWICYIVTGLSKAFGSSTSGTSEMTAISLAFLSCPVNPVIYGYMNRLTRNEILKYFSRASHRITGRESVLMDNEDYRSSTLTTNFSSSRATSAAVLPANRTLISSLRLGCRALDMMTIQEVSESDEEATRGHSNTRESVNINTGNRKMRQSASEGVVLHPHSLPKRKLKRWLSNDDITTNGSVRSVIPQSSKHSLKCVTSGSRRPRPLVRTHSMSSDLFEIPTCVDI